MSAFLNLSRNDFAKAGVIFVLAAVFSWLAQQFNAPGFDFTGFRWDELFKVAVMASVTYLGKNLISTADGKVLGKIG